MIERILQLIDEGIINVSNSVIHQTVAKQQRKSKELHVIGFVSFLNVVETFGIQKQ